MHKSPSNQTNNSGLPSITAANKQPLRFFSTRFKNLVSRDCNFHQAARVMPNLFMETFSAD